MAAPARIISLNLGTQTIGLAEFHKADNGGLILNAYKQTEILSDPSAEAARLPQTRLAVSGLRDELKLKYSPVNYAIAGQNIFARFVKLPTVAEEKVEQIIGFEAQQNVPFPIEEVVWDYQLVGGNKDGQVEVVLVAIKADLLDDLNDVAQSGGFRTNVVDAAPMALYNAFRYNYSDLEGTTLLVDLGARTTNLIFIEPNKVFSRSIPIGGNTITSNLAKEFQESFASAEDRKRREGYVSLGGAYADDKNPEVAKMAKIIRNTMTRLHAEISRSINFYRAQQGGSQPARILLAGGTANLPYLREFFAEKFQLPLEYFNPLRNVTLTSHVPVDDVVKNAHMLGELVGLSLRSVNTCPMELNLRPSSVVRSQKISARRPYFVMAGACLLLALAGWWLYFLRATSIQSLVLGKVSGQVQAMQGFESKLNNTSTDIAKISSTADPLIQTIEARQYWPTLISEINYHQPERYVWVTLLEPTSGGKVINIDDPGKPLGSSAINAVAATNASTKPGAKTTVPSIDGVHIKGLYLANDQQDQVVSEFVRNLAKSEFFKLDPRNENSIVTVRTPQDDKSWAFAYELQLPLSHPLPLQ